MYKRQPFSFAFDYTFFCAIPPTVRAKWGERNGDVVRPGGLLVALAFPLGALASSSSSCTRSDPDVLLTS